MKPFQKFILRVRPGPAVFLLRAFPAGADKQDSGKNILLEISAELHVLGQILFTASPFSQLKSKKHLSLKFIYLSLKVIYYFELKIDTLEAG